MQLVDLNNISIINELSDDDLWGIIVLIERDFKHPLASLLFKEGIKRSINRKATFVYKDG